MVLCKVCGVNFARKDGLAQHVRSVHNKQKLKCDICEKSFSRKYNVNQHMNFFHPNNRRESVIQFASSANIVTASPMKSPVINTDMSGGGEFSEEFIYIFFF